MRSTTLALMATTAVAAHRTCTFTAQTWWYPYYKEVEMIVSTMFVGSTWYQSDSCLKQINGGPLEITCDMGGMFEPDIDLTITAFPDAWRDDTIDTVGHLSQPPEKRELTRNRSSLSLKAFTILLVALTRLLLSVPRSGRAP